jgi:putative phosphoribosyl transferase
VAVPIVSQTIADILKTEADELVSVIIPSEEEFLGSIGAYYEKFPQITDQEVSDILTKHQNIFLHDVSHM